jgi:hypothetical protein
METFGGLDRNSLDGTVWKERQEGVNREL